MSLLMTIFLLVFIAQLITWVGKTVLLHIVGVIFVFSTVTANFRDVRQVGTNTLASLDRSYYLDPPLSSNLFAGTP
jgi:asparagine N-glycosylation enzyme membrane subunit Stt3